MIVIKVNEDDTIERAIKKYKRKFEKVGILKEIRARKEYVKPSVKRRQQLLKAKYIQRLKSMNQ
jgi:small subunit ribosomal protein S21